MSERRDDRGRNRFGDLERMFEQFRREFERMTSDFEEQWGAGGAAGMGIDVADRGDEFVVTADVPGYEKGEIDLRLVGETLHLSAEHERESEEGDADYLRSEREHRSMRESVALPEPVDAENVSATCTNGVLTVRLPKQEPTETGGHRIDVE